MEVTLLDFGRKAGILDHDGNLIATWKVEPVGNSNVNDRGKIHGGGSPKPTNMGKDLGPHATNVISGTKVTTKPLSPSANAASITPQKGK